MLKTWRSKIKILRREITGQGGLARAGENSAVGHVSTSSARVNAESAPLVSFPDGIEVLHDCQNAVVDICFVHGLTGNRRSTWTADGESVPWPGQLIPRLLDKVRIITYGYDAYVVRKTPASSNRLMDHAGNLLIDLAADRRINHATSRPLILVAHSLGGLVCKKAILLSQTHPEVHLQDVFRHVKGIIFMGTPHRGSWMAAWAKLPASALCLVKSTNKWLLEVLETDNQLLESVQVEFWSMIRRISESGGKIEIACAYEEMPLRGIKAQVVPKESATLEGYLSFSIHADHRDMVRFDSVEHAGFKRLMGELGRWVGEIVESTQIKLVETTEQCLRSLAFPQMNDRSNGIERAMTGTCTWLSQHSTYKQWDTSERGLLWIKGKPGSGKSTLLRYALDNATGSRDRDRVLILSFFFHGRGVDLQKAPLGFFRCILHQLISQASVSAPDLITTYEKRCKVLGEPGQAWEWHVRELWDYVQSSISDVLRSRTVRVFVDALDECGEENAVELVNMFRTLLKQLPPTESQFVICFSCRHYPIVEIDYGSVICTEHENAGDISTYVHTKGSLLSPKIRNLISGRASGIFMWSRIAIEGALRLRRRGAGWEVIKAKINELPPELHDLYTGLLSDLADTERDDSRNLFQWIAFARRPLFVEELRWALILSAGSTYFSLQECQDSQDYDSDIRNRIQTLSRGLIEVLAVSGEGGRGGCTVQFIHQSVRDFLLTNWFPTLIHDGHSRASQSYIEEHSHYQLAGTCIRYFVLDEIGQLEPVPLTLDDGADYDSSYARASLHAARTKARFPFLTYAVVAWLEHAANVNNGIMLRSLLELLAWPSNTLMWRWAVAERILAKGSETWVPGKFHLLHVLSAHGILGLLKVVLETSSSTATATSASSVDARDAYSRTPLHHAVRGGHKASAEILLDNGAAVDARDSTHETPLHHAIVWNRPALGRLLLEHGANIEARDWNSRTPLQLAKRFRCHQDMVQLLLGKGADSTAWIDPWVAQT